ncbi:MAG: hypothetical protein GC146_08655 [Limimaricola sp.]|uniref:YdeI/OmpD-associated family protein n=1 Tax=Limimaricola sp. TaxID=2211665 RepID=UPI001D92CC68|nr:YdeI/OmpD-associated family protein [Limimaricola sp.]MBI1417277.1 hypothetical protein [Limimaricola sp.]
MTPTDPLTFATAEDLDHWFDLNGASATQLWVRLYKVATGIPSVTWEDCIRAALRVGWIDGIRKSEGADSYILRLTPRKPRSVWSQRNRDWAETLIAEGRMTAAGLAQVEAARADGRWDAAYAGSKTMEIPADFLAELAKHPKAQAQYQTLNRQNLYAIYYRVTSAKTDKTRAARIARLIKTLNDGGKFH